MARHAQPRVSPFAPGPHRARLAVQAGLLAVLVVVGSVVVLVEAGHDARTRAEDRVLGVARTVAESPFVRSAVQTDDPATRLRPFAGAVVTANDLDFVVVMAPDRTRWTHPDPSRVGRQFVGRIEPALRGETFTETFTGSPDPSVRAVSPVTDQDGEVIALVAVGTSSQTTAGEVVRRLPWLLLVLLVAAAVTFAGEPLARRWERQRSRRATRSSARPTDA